MKWIGLTGGIASGKTTVAEIIKKNAIPVVNADEVAHLALSPASNIYPQIIQAFGPGILNADRTIDRAKLGAIVFKNAAERDILEKLVHPFVRAQVAIIKNDLIAQGHKLAFYDVPLLFEKNMEKDFDQILLVDCDPETQIQRLITRNLLTREQANLRLQAQLPLAEKRKRTKNIVDNSRTLKDLEAQVLAWLAALKK